MLAKVVALEWIVSNKTFEQGLNGKPPHNAIRNRRTGEYVMGENGMYYTFHPNRYMLVLKSPTGERYKEDIMSYVKFVKPGIKVTKHVRQAMEAHFIDREFEVKKVSDGNWIVYGIYEAIGDALSSY